MSSPNWKYVAGFFDGEGCIEIRSTRPILLITQAKREDAVLIKISEFLKSRGIRNILRPRKYSNPRWLPQEQIEVLDWKSVRRCLIRLSPYLIVKKRKAISAIKCLSTRKFRQSLVPDSRMRKAVKAYLSGLSFRSIERRNRIQGKSLRNYMKTNGIKTRSRSEAVTLWHASR